MDMAADPAGAPEREQLVHSLGPEPCPVCTGGEHPTAVRVGEVGGDGEPVGPRRVTEVGGRCR